MSARTNLRTAADPAAEAQANRLIERLIAPPLVANWGLDESGQVVCLWENQPSKRPFTKRKSS